MEKISGLYLYDPGLEHDWDGFANYLANGNQADVYLGDAETTERAVTLRGARAIQPPFSCQASSRWYDLSLEQRKTPDGIRYQYRQTRKVRWLSHDEIASPEFIRFNEAARACAIQARQIIKL
ncbi:hypothetical protein HA051_21405 [Chromobacterium vaccinii]|nr:hypothetical protein [Chromobacterium vaccinii]